MQKENYGNYSVIVLIISLIITKALISAPTLYIQHSQSAGWIEVLISGIFEIPVLAIIIKLLSNFENCDFLKITEIAFGKIGRGIFGSIYTMILLISSAAVFRCFEELTRNTIARGESYEKLGLFIAAGGIVAAYLGMREQLNFAGIILPIVLCSVFLILFINISRLSVTNLQPCLGTGADHILKNALLKNSSYFELGIILFFFPFLKEKNRVKSISFTSLALSTLLLSTITLMYQLAVPYEAAGTFSIPLYQMTRMLKAGTFFQRIEPLNIFLWCGSLFIYVGVGVWLSTFIFKKTFFLKDNRPLVFVFFLIVYFLALIPGSETSVEKIYDFLLTYSYIFYPIIPICILITASFKGRGV